MNRATVRLMAGDHWYGYETHGDVCGRCGHDHTAGSSCHECGADGPCGN